MTTGESQADARIRHIREGLRVAPYGAAPLVLIAHRGAPPGKGAIANTGALVGSMAGHAVGVGAGAAAGGPGGAIVGGFLGGSIGGAIGAGAAVASPGVERMLVSHAEEKQRRTNTRVRRLNARRKIMHTKLHATGRDIGTLLKESAADRWMTKLSLEKLPEGKEPEIKAPDALERSVTPKKRGMSTGAKMGLAAAGAAGLGYMALRTHEFAPGKLNNLRRATGIGRRSNASQRRSKSSEWMSERGRRMKSMARTVKSQESRQAINDRAENAKSWGRSVMKHVGGVAGDATRRAPAKLMDSLKRGFADDRRDPALARNRMKDAPARAAKSRDASSSRRKNRWASASGGPSKSSIEPSA